jgi:hypothetical protein
MRSSADKNVVSSQAFALDLANLFNERFWVYHYSISNDTLPFAL